MPDQFDALATADTKGLIGQLVSQARSADQQATASTAELSASRDREAAARAAQVGAQAPVRAQLKEALGTGGPPPPEYQAPPAAPSAPQIDEKAMGETLSLITALASLGGLLTRHPLTAALNSFSQGVQGYVQGKQQVFQDSLKQFEASLKEANSANETAYRRYQAARDKYSTDIQGMTLELQQIAAETQNPIDMELARQGRIVDLMKLNDSRNAKFEQVMSNVLRMRETEESRRQASADRRAIAAQASADRRFQADLAHQDRQAAAAAKGQGGNATQNRMQRVMAIDVDNAAYNIDRLLDMSQAKGELIGGSPAFANKFGGSWTADFKRYLETGAIPEDLQGADALLMNLAFDIASGQSGGSGQLAQAKIAELENQMPLDSMPESVKQERWQALFHRVKAINQQLPEASRVDLSAYEPVLGVSSGRGTPDAEATEAQNAIASGADPAKVKARYKARTGKDLP